MTEDVFQFDEPSHSYRFNGVKVPYISLVLKACGFVDTRFFTDEHRARGHAVHAACNMLLDGSLDWSTVHESIRPRVEGFAAFLKKHSPRVLLAEKPLYSKVHGFAGTPDLVLEVNGLVGVWDIKSGKSGLAAEIQTAFQAILVEEHFGPVFDVAERYALELPADGGFKPVPHKDRGDRAMALNALSMVNRRINCGELSL